MKYTAEEVREWAAFAQAQGKLYASMKGAHEPWEKLEAMLTAYAESIEADAQLTVMIEHLTSIVESQAAEPTQSVDAVKEDLAQ